MGKKETEKTEIVDCFLCKALGEQLNSEIKNSIDAYKEVDLFDNEYIEFFDVTVETIGKRPNKAIIYEIYALDNVYLLSDNLNNMEKKVKFCFCFENGNYDIPRNETDYDRSEQAWEVYENIYGDLLTEHEMDKKIVTYNGTSIEVSGDCCFNFNIKKFKYFEDIIENGNIDDETRLKIEDGGKTEQDYRNYVFKMLKFCKMMHHSTLNISLMPKTGGLNNVKQNISNDRFDSFLWILSLGLSGQDAVILGLGGNMCVGNRQILKAFLERFDGDIVNYCKAFYPLDIENDDEYRRYIENLIEQGKRAIITPVDVHRYLNSACKFWKYRKYHPCLEDDSFKLTVYDKNFQDSIFNAMINL